MDFMKWVRAQAERSGAVVAVVAGIAFLIAGWIGVSDKVYPGEQIPYIASGGLIGLALIGIGAVLWLSADLRDEWRKLDRIEAILQADPAPRQLVGYESAGRNHVAQPAPEVSSSRPS